MSAETIELERRSSHAGEVAGNSNRFAGRSEENKTSDAEPSPRTNEDRSQTLSTDGADELDLSCGLGRLRTNVFGAKFSNLYTFAFCFGLSNLFSQMNSQVIQVQLTSLERQFNIDNARAGLFDTASRIGFISTLLFAGHFAKKYHIPMIVGIAGVIQGLILTIPAIMQFVDPYELPNLIVPKNDSSGNSSDDGDGAKYLCLATERNDTKNETTGEVKQVQFLVVLAVQAVKGLTDTFHNGFLPVLYMDDNLIDKSKMGLVLGIWQVITELSGPIGKQINGILTEIPIDLKKTDMTSDDRRFVSAWWLAFLVFGLGTSLFSVPIMLFPRQLVTAKQRQEALSKAMVTFAGGNVPDEVADTEETDKDGTESESPATVVKIEQDPSHLSESKRRRYSLINNQSRKGSRKEAQRKDSGISHYSGASRRPSLFPPVVGPTERKVSITGDLVFEQPIKRQDSHEDSLKDLLKDFPKALVRVMKKPVFVLLLVDIAIVSVPFSGTSMFRNTYMANEYNVPMSEVALVSAITTAVGLIAGSIVSSWLSSRVTTKMGYALIVCSTWFVTIIFIPFFFIYGCGNEVVYGADGEYGRSANLTDCNCTLSHQLISCGDDHNNYISPCYAGCMHPDGKHFVGCNLLNSTLGSTVTPGLCSTDCHTNFIIYAALHGVMFFFFSLSMIPRRLLTLRIVDPQDRGFATSLFNFSFVLIAIPSPNLFGGIIDGTCLIWDDNLCTLYDRDKIRYLMSGIDISVHSCVQITFLIMVLLFKCEEIKMKKAAAKEKNNTITQKETETAH